MFTFDTCSVESTRGITQRHEAGRESFTRHAGASATRHPETPDVRTKHPQPTGEPRSDGDARRRTTGIL